MKPRHYGSLRSRDVFQWVDHRPSRSFPYSVRLCLPCKPGLRCKQFPQSKSGNCTSGSLQSGSQGLCELVLPSDFNCLIQVMVECVDISDTYRKYEGLFNIIMDHLYINVAKYQTKGNTIFTSFVFFLCFISCLTLTRNNKEFKNYVSLGVFDTHCTRTELRIF